MLLFYLCCIGAELAGRLQNLSLSPGLLDQRGLKDLSHSNPTGLNPKQEKKKGEALRTYQHNPGEERRISSVIGRNLW